MAQWKRILTTDDVSNTNLGSSDLAPTTSSTTFLRKFTLPAATDSSALQFEGYMQYNSVNSTLRPILRIETDSNSAAVSQNYVYIASLSLGSISSTEALDGTSTKKGYTMPQFDEDHEGNKILVSSANWSTAAGSVEFMTASNLLKPSSPQTGSTLAAGSGTDLRKDDTLLLYDHSGSELRNMNVGAIKTFTLQTGRNETLAQGGPFYMKGINGVLLSAVNGHGLVVPHDSYLTCVSGAFEKVSGNSQRRRVNIYQNNSLVAYTGNFGETDSTDDYVHFSTESFTNQSSGGATSQISFTAGDLITFAFFGTSSYSGNGSHFQINGYFSTVPVTI